MRWPHVLVWEMVTISSHGFDLQSSLQVNLQRWPQAKVIWQSLMQSALDGTWKHSTSILCLQPGITLVTFSLQLRSTKFNYISQQINYKNYRQLTSLSSKWHSTNTSCPQGSRRFVFTSHKLHSSQHFLVHLWFPLQFFLFFSQGFLQMYCSCSGSFLTWHFSVHVCPHSKRISHGIGQRMVAGSSPQGMDTLGLQSGRTRSTGKVQRVVPGSLWHSIHLMWPQGKRRSTWTLQGPHSTWHFFLHGCPLPQRGLWHGFLHLKLAVDSPHWNMAEWPQPSVFSTLIGQNASLGRMKHLILT